MSPRGLPEETRPEFHIWEDEFVTDGDLSHVGGKIFFSPSQIALGLHSKTAPRHTEGTKDVQTLMLR